MKKYVTTIIACLVASFFAYHLGKEASTSVTTDTLEYTDTIPYYMPVAVESTIVRYEKVTLPVVRYDSVTVNDTVMSDSVVVQVPITQKHYSDSTYDAWVSGYNPVLDSIHTYNKTRVITIQEKPKRWGIGLQGGYGITPKGFQPYIGVGVHINI